MKIQFLGTSAAHSFPLAFCRCEICIECRAHGGKSLRKRASLLINDEMLIDLGPDFMASCFEYKVDSSQIKFLLQTHYHSDHFSAGQFYTRYSGYAGKDFLPMKVIASQKTLDGMSRKLAHEGYIDDGQKAWEQSLFAKPMPIEAMKGIKVSGYEIIGFDSGHCPRTDAFVFLIKKDGRAIFYGTDLLEFSDKIYEFLIKTGISLDLLILDQTYGHGIRGGGHLNADDVCAIVKRLRKHKVLSTKSKIFATHLSHEGHYFHEKQNEIAKGNGYEIAYDGLTLHLDDQLKI